jgi:hypothetical protein
MRLARIESPPCARTGNWDCAPRCARLHVAPRAPEIGIASLRASRSALIPLPCAIGCATGTTLRRMRQPQWAQPQPPSHRHAERPRLSANELAFDAGGRPAMTRKTSRTKSPIAISLNNDAWGRLGQNWFAAQNRKAVASRAAFTSSMAAGLCAAWKIRYAQAISVREDAAKSVWLPAGNRRGAASCTNKSTTSASVTTPRINGRCLRAGRSLRAWPWRVLTTNCFPQSERNP